MSWMCLPSYWWAASSGAATVLHSLTKEKEISFCVFYSTSFDMMLEMLGFDPYEVCFKLTTSSFFSAKEATFESVQG